MKKGRSFALIAAGCVRRIDFHLFKTSVPIAFALATLCGCEQPNAVLTGSPSAEQSSQGVQAPGVQQSAAHTLTVDEAGVSVESELRFQAASQRGMRREPTQVIPDEVLIKFKKGTDAAAIAYKLQNIAAKSVRRYRSMPTLRRIKLQSGESAASVVERYRKQADVEYAEPNVRYRAFSTFPNDPAFGQQWGLHNIGQDNGNADADIDAPEAWDITTGSATNVVAVVDSGIDYNHPDLAANMYRSADCTLNGIDDDGNGVIDDCYGIDTVNNNSNPMDDNGHGTHIAGIIAAASNNNIGVAGVAWQTKLMPCKFMGADGTGTAADAIECLDYIDGQKDRGVNIVATNLAWGAGVNSQALRDAIAAQMQRGILVITAAGNDGLDISDAPIFKDGTVYPCAYDLPNIVCVSSSSRIDAWDWSGNVGSYVVDISAPGNDIWSTLPGNTYGAKSGTSIATGYVAGVASLIKSANPTYDWRAIKNLLLTGGDLASFANAQRGIFWQTISGRRLNANGSLTCANSTLTRRVSPIARSILRGQIVGAPLLLRVMNINCANPAGAVSVTINPGNTTVTLVDNGAGADQIAGDGIYSANWTPATGGTYLLRFPGSSIAEFTPADDLLTVEVDEYLKPGFPQKIYQSDGGFFTVHAAPPSLVANIDATPDLEIIVPSLAGPGTFAWKATGASVSGWPVQDGATSGAAKLSAGNLTGATGSSEVFAGFSRALDGMTAYDGSGTLLPGWPSSSAGSIQWAAALGDIDNDGIDEIFLGGFGALHGYRSTGASIPGFPTTANSSLHIGAGTFTPFLVDLDGDGKTEIVSFMSSSNGGFIAAFNTDGSVVSGFPVDTHDQIAPIGAGDVDGDGHIDLVFVSRRSAGALDTRTIAIYGSDGSLEREFTLPFAEWPTDVLGALADMNGDGIPEIVVTTYWWNNGTRVQVFDGFGNALSGWPVRLTNATDVSAPAIGDLDGDGQPEIAVLGGGLNLLHRDGTLVSGFPRPIGSTGSAGFSALIDPIIADIDNDGRNDVVITTDAYPGSPGYYDKVFAYDLHGSALHTPTEWGQFGGGPQRQFYYKLGKTLINDAFLTVTVKGSGSVASTPSGISCGSDCIQRFAKGTSVTLTATPTTGTQFKWRGACANQSGACFVNIQDLTTAFADFRQFSLTTSVAGTGTGTIASNPSGINCGGDCSESYLIDSIISLTAAPTPDSEFAGWTGACSGVSSCVVTMTTARTVGAIFNRKPELTLTVLGNGTGTVTSNPAGINCGVDCAEQYFTGTVVTLTVTPSADSEFRGWSGACTGTGTCTTTMNASKSVTATIAKKPVLTVVATGNGTGTVSSAPLGINCPTDCSEPYGTGTSVVLTATPTSDSVFTGWTGGCVGTGTCTVSITQSLAVTGTFMRRQILTTALSGSGSGVVTSNPSGISCGTDCSEAFAPNISVTLTPTPATDSLFVGWSGDCQGAGVCTVSMTSARNVVAMFSTKQSLSVSVTGAGTGIVISGLPGINCGADCSEFYPTGTLVSLSSVPAFDSELAAWSGDCNGNGACTVTMSAPRSVGATFVKKPVLTVVRAGSGSGNVSSNQLGINCGTTCAAPYGTGSVVILTATPTADSEFAGWSGACAGQTPTCTVSMSASLSVTASFRVATPPTPPTPPSSGTSGKGGGGTFDWRIVAFLTTLLYMRRNTPRLCKGKR